MRADDERLALAAAHAAGLIRTDRWPMVAAQLLADGFDGHALVELASLSANATSWEVEPLVPMALREIETPDLSAAQLGEALARLLGAGSEADYAAVRVLASLAPVLDFPGGWISEAYYLAEYLDCECHKSARADVDRLQAELEALPRLDLSDGLQAALVGI